MFVRVIVQEIGGRDWIFSGAVAPVMLVQKQGSYLRFLANRITLADPIVINKATIT